jgi:phosphate uptake regulator
MSGPGEVTRLRAALERMAEAAIEMLDAMDAAGIDREPDGEDEVVSEDDGVVRRWFRVGAQPCP